MSQAELFGPHETRSLLDGLIVASRLYHTGKDYAELLAFVTKLRNVAPFNAMLLQIQKPGITYVASAHEWATEFERAIKPDARPLLILWPFAPVVTVYDIQDTLGKDLPESVLSFPARGQVPEAAIANWRKLLSKRGIVCHDFDGGDGRAGVIRAKHRALKKGDRPHYEVGINGNHQPVVQFVTLLHELAHLFLGHLGEDKVLNIPRRRPLGHDAREVEAESAACVVCRRYGVEPLSERYLANFVKADAVVDDLEIFQIMRAAGQVETLMQLARHTRFGPKA